MTLSERVTVLAQAMATEVKAVRALAATALQRGAGDGSTQTVEGPVNFQGAVTLAGVAAVATSASQSLSNKTLNGFRIATATFGTSSTMAQSAPVALVTTTAAVVVTLPAVLSGLTVVVKVTVSGTPNVTVQRSGTTALIDGQASIQLSTAYAWVWLTCSGTNWFITGRG